MMKHFCGEWKDCEDNIEALLAIGVEIKFKQCWKYDFGKDAPHIGDGRWNTLKTPETLEKKSWERKTLTEKWWGTPHRCNFESYCVISYRVDDEKYPLLSARYTQYRREENERISAEIKAEYEAWCEEQQRKLEAYLEKHPWAANPEGWQEGIDYERVNDPDKGEVIVDIRRK